MGAEISRWTAARLWVRERWWARWSLDGLVVVVVLSLIMSWQSIGLLGDGEPAPAFSLRAVGEEGTKTLADYRGKKTLLVFWAPWCGVCRTESDTLSGLHDGGNGPYHVVSIALGYENIASVKKFMADEGVDYPVLLGGPAVRDAYKVSQYPTLYILDEEGRVEDTLVGYTTSAGLKLRLWL
jgi:thiol-disulfide isomerase/thioredoxin